jgi:hypothetical protein
VAVTAFIAGATRGVRRARPGRPARVHGRARRCDRFADREADFEIAWAATEVMPIFRPSVV